MKDSTATASSAATENEQGVPTATLVASVRPNERAHCRELRLAIPIAKPFRAGRNPSAVSGMPPVVFHPVNSFRSSNVARWGGSRSIRKDMSLLKFALLQSHSHKLEPRSFSPGISVLICKRLAQLKMAAVR
jgi:hypothetical protein